MFILKLFSSKRLKYLNTFKSQTTGPFTTNHQRPPGNTRLTWRAHRVLHSEEFKGRSGANAEFVQQQRMQQSSITVTQSPLFHMHAPQAILGPHSCSSYQVLNCTAIKSQASFHLSRFLQLTVGLILVISLVKSLLVLHFLNNVKIMIRKCKNTLEMNMNYHKVLSPS